MINILSQAGKVDYGTVEYLLDSISDLDNLVNIYGVNCDAGSTAFVIATSQVFMKNGRGEWIEL